MKLKEKTIEEFVEKLASSDPTPGGGGAAAMAGAVGMALGNMVGALTVGKRKYADVESDMKRLMDQADDITEKLMFMADEDAEAFKPLAEAYSMPAETKEQQEEKKKVMERCLVKAARPPLEIMKLCGWALDVIKELAEKGSVLAVSDAGVAAVLCRAAMEGASLNVFVNTGMMKNREAAKHLEWEANSLLDRYIPLSKKTYKKVRAKLKG